MQKAILEFWYIESGPLDRLWSLKKKKKYTVQNGWKKNLCKQGAM